MNKKNMCLISVILVMGMAGSAFAQDCDWTNFGGDRLWSNPSNWDPALPTAADKAGIRQGGVGPIINSSTTAVASQCMVGDWGHTDTLDMTGGSLTVGAIMVLGYGVNDNGTLTISGGTITVSTEGLQVGRDGVGTLNMTGGSINVSTFAIAALTGTGHVQLDGGTISATTFTMNSSATMDLTNSGVLIVTGDAISTINGYIGSGWITAYGGGGGLAVDYDVTNPGKTTVSGQSPEKASYPSPGNGATGVSINIGTLSWTAGQYATSHDVYFGTDSTPDATEFQGNQPGTTFNISQLPLDTTYYWRVDEVATGNPSSPWVGDVWSFTTQISTATLRKGPYLIYPGNNTEMQVLWQLDYSDTCSVEWGLDTSYSAGSAGAPEYGVEHQYKHTITALTPGDLYYYKVNVGTGATTGSFRAAPSDSATDIKFLMGGDRQSLANLIMFQNAANAVNSTMTADPEYQSILLFAGDMVTNGDTEEQWDSQWFNRTLPEPMQMMASIPIQGSMGNHESSGTGFEKFYPYPFVGNHYWSFDYGPVHVAVVNFETIPYTVGSAQYNWLANDMATTNKSFKILLTHAPAWGAGSHPNTANLQTDIQPLCLQYGVQMFLGGHNHNYAHAIVDGVHHVTSGGFGASMYNVNTGADYIVTAIESQNFQTVEVSGNIMTVTTLDTGLAVLDTFLIVASECGDQACDPGEECDCPSDCGSPPSSETSCTDGFDNDCDGNVDCTDADCNQDPACRCGNGTCESGEDCNSCPADCISKTKGKPSSQYCCGDGTCGGAENETNCAVDCGSGSYCDDGTCDPGEDECSCPEDCGTPPSTETNCDDGIDEDCDSSTDCDDADCLGDPACPSCGDVTCDAGEDQCNCPADCGTPPSTETNCTDGIDEDCDGGADCGDTTGDCDLDPACDCASQGEACTVDADCCSNNCFERKGYCKP